MSVGYHGSSKMAVVATAALLSPSITAPLAVLRRAAFVCCRALGDALIYTDLPIVITCRKAIVGIKYVNSYNALDAFLTLMGEIYHYRFSSLTKEQQII